MQDHCFRWYGIIIIAAFTLTPLFVSASSITGIILPGHSYAWGENLGWVNFAASSSDVRVTDTGLSGDIWSQTYGWINLAPANGGVTNDGEGNLSGYAWGQDVGWINFQGATINSDGRFTGIIGSASTTAGRVSFDCTNCDVETDWRPESVRNAISVTVGGSASYGLAINSGADVTPTTSVSLTIYGTGAYTMALSNTPDFAGTTWIPYQTSLPWVLRDTTGTETVYGEFKAVSGKVIGNASATIQYLPNASTAESSSSMIVPTSSSVSAEIQFLEAELAALEAQANASPQRPSVTPASSSSGYTFTRDLQFGMTGSDVTELQKYLNGENKGPAARALKAHGLTRNFASLTKAALIEFQKVVGIRPASGYFGPITRGWINAHSQ